MTVTLGGEGGAMLGIPVSRATPVKTLLEVLVHVGAAD